MERNKHRTSLKQLPLAMETDEGGRGAEDGLL